ncbi:PGRS family protein [Chondromyces crocatus]|uniref:PGRS family protein n=1 Tax=Chondromyces crocatus TaxID=52 RepID=UPI0012E2AC9F|nr:PGRS family protein [Chondromyces crocatus]
MGAGQTPVGCSPRDVGWGVEGNCGVFVSSSQGDDEGPGTREKPLKTLARAIVRAQEQDAGGRIYACGEEFQGPVTVPGGVTIFGSLDCAHGWTLTPNSSKTRTAIVARPGEIPLRIEGISAPVRLEELDARARLDPEDPATRGMSSIAAVAEGSVTMFRVLLDAGPGGHGKDGEGYDTEALAGLGGNAGADACAAPASFGGLEQLFDCGTPDFEEDDSIGGLGGSSTLTTGGDGAAGWPGADDQPNGGKGGGTSQLCRPGDAGMAGQEGVSGAGATGTGTLTANGFLGAAGGPGGKGGTAQGGGGGGAMRGGVGAMMCASQAMGAGASGGGGGSGGCGGLGGRGGGAGGASIALVSLGASLVFDGSVLSVATGGKGGAGGPGQEGGPGGAGGPGGGKGTTSLAEGCAGGKGGPGGAGGRGGGGAGGPSIGLAFIGEAPSVEGLIVYGSNGGRGGEGAGPEQAGVDGVKSDLFRFEL